MSTGSNVIIARVSGDLTLFAVPPKPLERLRLALSFPNKKYIMLERMGRSTGTEPERIEALVEMPDGSVHVPRGSVSLVKDILARDDYVLKVTEDNRSTTGLYRAVEELFSRKPVPLRDYQQQSVHAIVKHTQGLVVLPPGSGKSRTGIGAIVALSRTTLILVHTIDLVEQWEKSIQELLHLNPGVFGGGRKEYDRPVVIGIINSVLPYLELNPSWGHQFGFVICDESHLVPNNTYQRVLPLLPARYRLGLTATPEREDGMSPLMHWSFGDTLLTRSAREMIALGVLMPADIDLMESGWTYAHHGPESKRQSATETALTLDAKRNGLIARCAATDAKAGETVLVLSNRKPHTRKLAEMIREHGVEAIAVTSATAKKPRKEAIQALKDGKLPVMVATSLADLGLDVPRLSRVILAFPQKAAGGTMQRLGRLLRLWPDKHPKLIDIVDSEVPMLAKRAQARKRVYREMGLLRE